MIIKNALVYGADFKPAYNDVEIENGIISSVGKSDGEALDFSGLTLLPGFIDIHTHGCCLADASDGSVENMQKISCYLAGHGITSFCPTTMTLPEEQLTKAFSAIAQCMGNESGAYIQGVNMEGPYISIEKKGAQSSEYVRKPEVDEFHRLNAIAPIKLVDVAPEVDGALEFAEEISKECVVSAAHTAATYDQAMLGFSHGFTNATHLFNAMTPIKNREPGVPTAVFDSDNITAELICDGFHNHPAVLRMAFSLLGKTRAVVISDSMSAAGMGDGDYSLGGQTVYVRNGRATLADGTIAASTTNTFDEFKNLLRFGIDFETALRACTVNPAGVIGVDGVTGTIEEGKRADIIAVDKSLTLKAVFVKGRQIL